MPRRHFSTAVNTGNIDSHTGRRENPSRQTWRRLVRLLTTNLPSQIENRNDIPRMLSMVGRWLRSASLWQVALAIYWLALIVSTHVPSDTPLVPGGQIDEIAHLIAFAILAVLLATTWQLSSGWLTSAHLTWAWAAIALFAAVDELTQSLFGRESSGGDWLADVAGALVGLSLFAWCRRLFFGRPFPIDEQSGMSSSVVRHFRFSLRTLFVAMAIVAGACYWLMLPTLNAQRFAAAIGARNYREAERLFAPGAETFPGAWKEHEYFEPKVIVKPWTWRDLLHGERHLTVGIGYGDDGGIIHCAGELRASRSGLEVVMFFP